MYAITVRLPDGTQVSAELPPGGACRIGRAHGRNDLVVEDATVSGSHAIVREEGGALTIEDLGSANGSYAGNQLLVPGQRYPITPDQPIDIGGSLLTVSEQTNLDSTRPQGFTNKVRYVGVLYTDIVRSTEMTDRLGQDESLRLLEWHNDTLKTRIKRFNGRVTKFTGDGYEATFHSVQDALGCAASCQRALARRNHSEPGSWQLNVRMGVNGGEALVSSGRVYGMPLILAARVMAQADAGQVFAPAHITGIVRGSMLKFVPRGPHQLKGLDGAVDLVEFLWQHDPYAEAPLIGSARQ